jgi:hypothetical protein
MPWIKLLENPVSFGGDWVDAYNRSQPIEIDILENVLDPTTGEMTVPSCVIPANKKTSDWLPGEEGALRADRDIDGMWRYYRFVVISPPFGDTLSKERWEEAKREQDTETIH